MSISDHALCLFSEGPSERCGPLGTWAVGELWDGPRILLRDKEDPLSAVQVNG